MRKIPEIWISAAFVLLVLAGCGDGKDPGTSVKPPPPSAPIDPNAKPYPLKTCVVSGEELGKMGEPFRFSYKGQEIKLCCKGCEKDFNKDPEKYLQKLAAAPK
jgi:YHS domain-containing protein